MGTAIKMVKKKHIRLSFVKGSQKDKEIEDLKQFFGISTNVEAVRLAIHAVWLDYASDVKGVKSEGEHD